MVNTLHGINDNCRRNDGNSSWSLEGGRGEGGHKCKIKELYLKRA